MSEDDGKNETRSPALKSKAHTHDTLRTTTDDMGAHHRGADHELPPELGLQERDEPCDGHRHGRHLWAGCHAGPPFLFIYPMFIDPVYELIYSGRLRLSPRRHASQQWAPIHESSLIVLVLTLWVFICAFNRGSATYGEVAISAALTVRVYQTHWGGDDVSLLHTQ